MAADELPYQTLPDPPERLRGATVLVRLVDGLAFRYRWATEGLADADLGFRPGEQSMTLGQLLVHVSNLVHWVERSLSGALPNEPEGLGAEAEGAGPVLAPLREATLACCQRLRAGLLEADDEALGRAHITGTASRGPQSFWSIVNGPLADALTHVGQVNAWRRLLGKPSPRADVFRGLPPKHG